MRSATGLAVTALLVLSGAARADTAAEVYK